MREDEPVDGRTAAEDYRQQLQAAAAEKSGFKAMNPVAFMEWANVNRPRLEAIAKANGTQDSELAATVEGYLDLLRAIPAGGAYDDLNVLAILAEIVKRIEKICSDSQIPIRDGVVYGVAPRLGLQADQLAVMSTAASIITVTQGFPIFCNLVSKAVALSLVHHADRASWDAEDIRRHLTANPDIRVYWIKILVSYALDGWPPDETLFTMDMPRQFTRIQLLQAMELFAVAHEYGHHVLRHGDAESSGETRDDFKDEFEADVFGRLVSLREGLDSDPPNLYTASGAGAVLMLGSLELVRRARRLLQTGDSQLPPRKSHPPLDDRIRQIAEADVAGSEEDRAVFDDLRSRARDLIDIIWAVSEPALSDLHQKGIRPETGPTGIEGWLPTVTR